MIRPLPLAAARSAAATARASSPARQASTIASSAGMIDASDDTTAARPAGLRASIGRKLSSVASAPK
jgi:hypothetical protein